MSDPNRIQHNIIRLVWGGTYRSFIFSHNIDDFAFNVYKPTYKLFIDSIDDPTISVQLFVSTNDEGVNVPGVFNISDYRDRCMFPDFQFDETYDLKCTRIREASRVPWVHDKVFWRGSVYDHHSVRKKLMSMSNDRFDFAKSDGTTHEDHCKYRYLIDVEGGPSLDAPTGYSLRVKFLLHSGRLLFIVDRPLWSWAEARLEPWVHYVPVKRDLSDLSEKVHWADTHPDEVSDIITRMTAIAPWRVDAVNQVKHIIHTMINK